ncbi:MAG: hypothetical protein P1Q69_18845, partial [Candidatus Thorarchaeota archaeon]|nr:hypothetical protein [Candidatus Thorarchaeota archaeon]
AENPAKYIVDTAKFGYTPISKTFSRIFSVLKGRSYSSVHWLEIDFGSSLLRESTVRHNVIGVGTSYMLPGGS